MGKKDEKEKKKRRIKEVPTDIPDLLRDARPPSFFSRIIFIISGRDLKTLLVFIRILGNGPPLAFVIATIICCRVKDGSGVPRRSDRTVGATDVCIHRARQTRLTPAALCLRASLSL